MFYYTVLLITYWLEGERLESRLVFQTTDECAVFGNGIHPHVFAAYENFTMLCIPSEMVSKTVRPQMRPEE